MIGVKFKIGQVYNVFFVGTGHETIGWHPAVITQNNLGNEKSPTLQVVPLTSKMCKSKLPTHVFLNKEECNLKKDSIAQCEGQTLVDKSRVENYITTLPYTVMREIAIGLTINTPMIKYLDETALLNLFQLIKKRNPEISVA